MIDDNRGIIASVLVTALFGLLVATMLLHVTGCGGDNQIAMQQGQHQTQDDVQNDSSSSAADDPCMACTGTIAEVTECLAGFGMEPGDC